MLETERNLNTELTTRYNEFPEGLTYQEFKGLPLDLRKNISKLNRIIQTDTYNRTMDFVKVTDGLRKKPILCNIEELNLTI